VPGGTKITKDRKDRKATEPFDEAACQQAASVRNKLPGTSRTCLNP
jgi:hypothetical protein